MRIKGENGNHFVLASSEKFLNWETIDRRWKDYERL